MLSKSDKRLLLALTAPKEIPKWFGGPAEEDLILRAIKRYFAWRWFYADSMLEAEKYKPCKS